MAFSGALPATFQAATGSPRHRDTDLQGFVAVLLRHAALIGLMTLTAVMLAIAYLATASPEYTAKTSILVDPKSRKIVTTETNQDGYGPDLALVESQVAIITSDSVLKRVVDMLDLTSDPEFAPARSSGGFLSSLKAIIRPVPPDADPATQAMTALSRSIKVKRAQKTYVVDIEVSASTPAKAATLTEAVVDAYLQDQIAAKTSDARRANLLVDARLGELRNQVRIAETRVDEFKRANRILTSEGGLFTEQQLTKLNGELITARAVAAEARAKQDQIQKALRTGGGAAVIPDAVKSGLVQKLRDQYAQVARREAALSTQLKGRHPVLIDVRSQLAEVDTQISAELKRVAAASQSEFQIAAARERELSQTLDRAKEDVARTATAQIKLRELESDAKASAELLQLFLAKAKETEELQNITTADARVLSPAALPTNPSKPLSFLILSLGLIGGLGLGVSSALIADHLDKSVRSSEDVADVTNLRVIAALPQAGRRTLLDGLLRALPMQIATQTRAGPFSHLIAALVTSTGQPTTPYRQAILHLAAKIKADAKPGRPATIMVVSPQSGTGASATSLALAYATARQGERVLLVDASSPNPELSRVFASSVDMSANDVVLLDNKDHLAAIIAREPHTGMAVLPIALADLRTLKTSQLRRLIVGLNGVSQNYDLIIIDGGAILEDEAVTSLMPVSDQVLLVARRGVTTASALATAMELLAPVRERLSGVVMNMSDKV